VSPTIEFETIPPYFVSGCDGCDGCDRCDDFAGVYIDKGWVEAYTSYIDIIHNWIFGYYCIRRGGDRKKRALEATAGRQKMVRKKTVKEPAEVYRSEDDALEYAESIINTVREPLIVLDQDLRAMSASRSFYEFFKVKPEDTVGQLIYDLGNKQWAIPKLRELLETILPKKTTFDNYEVEHEFATIGRRILLLNARQIQRVLGKEKIILLAIEDITERRQAENVLAEKTVYVLAEKTAQLERSNAELQRFAYVVSHDLQEPLRSISSYLQLLERRYKSKLDGEAREFIDFAIGGANRLQNMIVGLLAYSRLETPGDPFEMVNCESVLEHVLRDLSKAIDESKAEITHDPLPIVFADQAQLASLFQNLIANSIRYRGSEPPRIHVSAAKQDSEYVFAVRDNGIGIDPEYNEQIFVIFQRLHGRDVPGIGLGLALARRIVERLGGRIWVESEPGKGATFYFTVSIRGGDHS
jgi:PAS domain S-box-containing protein